MKKQCGCFIVAFLMLLAPCVGYADQYLELIRVTCIPELPHLSIERESSHDGVTFLDRMRAEGKDERFAWKILEKHGYLSAMKFDYECALPNGIFRVWGTTPEHRERGECGGNPRTIISMSKDGETIIDKAFFQPSCFSGNMPYLGRIDIEGGAKGWSEEAWAASVHNNLGNSILLWKFEPGMNQAYLDCLASNENFNKPGRDYEARKACGKVLEALVPASNNQ